MNVSPTIATAPPAGIPMPLGLTLQQYESVLRQQGTIQRRPDRRHGSYVLRFWVFDARKQCRIRKAIALGTDPPLIDRVSAVLEKWQAEHLSQQQSQRENKAREREEKRLRRAEQRRQELYLRIIAGGSQNYKQYIVTQFRKLRDSPYGKLWLMLYVAYQPPPKNGRPKNGERKWERFGVPKRVTWEQIQAEYKALMDRRPVGVANLGAVETLAPVVDRLNMESAKRNHIAAAGDDKVSGGSAMRTPTLQENQVAWSGVETQGSVVAAAA